MGQMSRLLVVFGYAVLHWGFVGRCDLVKKRRSASGAETRPARLAAWASAL